MASCDLYISTCPSLKHFHYNGTDSSVTLYIPFGKATFSPGKKSLCPKGQRVPIFLLSLSTHLWFESEWHCCHTTNTESCTSFFALAIYCQTMGGQGGSGSHNLLIIKKPLRFQQTQLGGLHQVFLTVSWDTPCEPHKMMSLKQCTSTRQVKGP